MSFWEKSKLEEEKEKLENLKKQLEFVYIPFVQKKNETKIQMEKFVRQIGTSLVQAYGNVTINIPDVPNLPKEEIIWNHKIIELLNGAVVSILFKNLGEIFPLWILLSDI